MADANFSEVGLPEYPRHIAEHDLAEEMVQENGLDAYLSQENREENPRVYHQHPSEVIYVPRRSEIKSRLRKMLEKDSKLPNDFSNWSEERCYAVYFRLMRVEKFDPRKHTGV